MFNKILSVALVLGFIFLTGCATVDPRSDYDMAAEQITQTTGQPEVYQPGDDEVVVRKVEELLEGGITVDEAVQICLLNNPHLQAAFFEIGMARADVVQSGLLSNPSLGLSLRLPSGGGLANLMGGISQNIADLWQIPARTREAGRSLDRAILVIAREAADLASDTKKAYYQVVGADRLYQISKENQSVASDLLDMVLVRRKAGAASVLDVNLSRGMALETELAVESARLALADARRELAELLGLTMDVSGLALLEGFPEIPSEMPDDDILIDLACVYCLEMQAARQEVAAAEARLEQEYSRIFPSVKIGVSFEREAAQSQGGRDILADTARASIANGGLAAPDIQPRSERRRNTEFVIGPSINLELPVFNQNQARIAKARYAYEQAVKTVEALKRAAYQEVRTSVDRVVTGWKLAKLYRGRILPLSQDNLDLSREAYVAGQASFLSVLEAQRSFLESRSRVVEAAVKSAITVAA
ncbi:MAG: TolC family protein, partial [Planctomycetota bacterium]